MTAGIPMTKSARQQKIIDLLARNHVRSQSELADLLAADGLAVTQATLSRDLVELDAVKVRVASGALVYAVPAEGGDRTPRAGAESAASETRLTRIASENTPNACYGRAQGGPWSTAWLFAVGQGAAIQPAPAGGGR